MDPVVRARILAIRRAWRASLPRSQRIASTHHLHLHDPNGIVQVVTRREHCHAHLTGAFAPPTKVGVG